MALVQRKLKDLAKIDFVNKPMTAKEVYNTYKPSVFINACLYDMATSTNITKVEDENKSHGYLFSDWGIGIHADNTLEWVSHNKALRDDDIKDFIAGSPTLVEYGVAKLDWGNKVSKQIQGKAYRSAIGFNLDTLFLFASENKMTLEELSLYMQRIGCRWAVNLDGGGSCHLQIGQTTYAKSSRKNASWFMVYDKEVADTDIGDLKGSDFEGLPEVRKMRICLDAGHGIETAGKRSPDGTLIEYEFNRDVTNRIKTILERHGVEVLLTCDDEHDVDLDIRCDYANKNKVDYFVSIHANADEEFWTSANGWEIHIVGKGGNAEKLAKCIHKYSKELGLKDRGIKVSNFQVLKDTSMPAVLIEHGFYTNKEECEKLKDSNFRQKCAECDAKGILEHLGIKYISNIQDENEPSAWALTAWNWCKEKGYLDGTNPKGTVTREMLAQVLFNLFGKEK
jgi:N-acetylmuramoyl-L-alanine amidase